MILADLFIGFHSNMIFVYAALVLIAFVSSKVNNKIKFNLMYDKNRSLQKKIKIEELRREIN